MISLCKMEKIGQNICLILAKKDIFQQNKLSRIIYYCISASCEEKWANKLPKQVDMFFETFIKYKQMQLPPGGLVILHSPKLFAHAQC